MSGRVARVGADRHLQRGACLVKLALAGIQHSQIVVGLRQLGVVFRQLGERGNGVGRFAGITLDHALEEAHLRITRFGCQIQIRLGHGFRQFAGAHQLGDVAVIVSMGIGGGQTGRHSNHPHAFQNLGTSLLHKAFEWICLESPLAGALYCFPL